MWTPDQPTIFSQLQPKVSFLLSDNSSGYKDNLCKVQIYFEDFDYDEISESAAYPVCMIM